MTYEGGDRATRSGRDRRVSDEGNKPIWDIIFKVSQLVAPLILAAMVYLISQQAAFDKRLAVVEYKVGTAPVDTALIRQISVIEERQGTVMRRLDSVESAIQQHREHSDYVEKRIPRER